VGRATAEKVIGLMINMWTPWLVWTGVENFAPPLGLDPRTFQLVYFILFSTYALQPSRLIVRSELDVPTFATRLLHACYHARAPSGGKWNCGKKVLGPFVYVFLILAMEVS
jgi:hypothetical protein